MSDVAVELCHGNYRKNLPWQLLVTIMTWQLLLLQNCAMATTPIFFAMPTACRNSAHGNYYEKIAMATTLENLPMATTIEKNCRGNYS